MHKILLISDTHGNLDIINETVKKTNADCVIHAGDFGFYDEQSILRLSPRELRLLVTHSPWSDLKLMDTKFDKLEISDEVFYDETIRKSIKKEGVKSHYLSFTSTSKRFKK